MRHLSSQLIVGDCRRVLSTLPNASVDCCVTSPPYFGLRDYGHEGQIGLEQTPDEYVQQMVAVFREVRRVLRNDGTLWLNLGDSYSAGGRGGGAEGSIQSNNIGSTTGAVFDAWKVPGFKPKNLLGIPWRVALALQADGWYLRQDIIWHKPNPMPESVTDRCTKAHEYIFLLSKSAKYFYNHQAIMEPAEYGEQHANKATSWGKNRKHPNKANVADYAFKGDNHTTSRMADGSFGRNRRSVWTVTTKPCKEAHFATYPTDLIVPCILAGSKPDGVVLDPFNGAGTTGLVALSNGRRYVGIELNPEYAEISMRRFGLMATLVNLRNHEECQREVEI